MESESSAYTFPYSENGFAPDMAREGEVKQIGRRREGVVRYET